MRKIMLVIDDFNDLLALEAFFRRMGFDVLSLGKDILVADALLGFVPDLVMATAKGRMVDGAKLAQRLAAQANPPKMALIYPAGASPGLPKDSLLVIDVMVEIPFQPKILLAMVGDLLNLDAESLVEKFEKQRIAKLQILNDRELFVSENGQRSGIQIVKGVSRSELSPSVAKLFASSEPAATLKAREPDVAHLHAERSKRLDDFVPALSVATESAADNVAPTAPTSDNASLRPQAADDSQSEKPGGDRERQGIPLTSAAKLVVSPDASKARLERNAKFLAEHSDETAATLSHADLVAAGKKLGADSAAESERLAILDAQKREFVKAMFSENAKVKDLTAKHGTGQSPEQIQSLGYSFGQEPEQKPNAEGKKPKP